MIFNIQGMDPSARSAGRWKIFSLRQLVDHYSEKHFVPFISVTETWLKPHIHDTQVSIPGFNIFRADRRLRIRGGALLYIHQSIPIIDSDRYDDRICEAIICMSSRKHIIASVYRPPHSENIPTSASIQSFCNVMNFVENYIKRRCLGNPEHYQIMITGDFNFPDITWNDLNASNCSSDTKASAEYLLSFMSRFLLAQYIMKPTRENNILDLLITNDPNVVQHVSSEDTIMSDHNCMHVLSSDFVPPSNKSCTLLGINDRDGRPNFSKLNYQKADFTKINQSLSEVNWDSMKENCSLEEFPLALNKKLFEICAEHTPIWKGKKISNKSQRSQRSLNRKKYRLRARLHAIKSISPGSNQIKILQQKIDDLQQKVKSCALLQIRKEEDAALQTIKSNPKAFYKYAKKFRKSKSVIKLLNKTDGRVTSDVKEIVDMFQHQFTSVFSDASAPYKVVPQSFNPDQQFSDITLASEDIISGIDDINSGSSCADNHIPTVVLKKLQTNIMLPYQTVVAGIY